jgi:hypothetical protein
MSIGRHLINLTSTKDVESRAAYLIVGLRVFVNLRK